MPEAGHYMEWAASGMAGKMADGVTAVDYGGFVDLVAEHPNNQSWL